MVSRFPRGVGRTRLMKLLFLVDAISSKELGHRITDIEWKRWVFGPFSREVLDVLDTLVRSERLYVDAGPEVRYIALEEPPPLPEDVRRVVDKVIREYGFMPLKMLLTRVYEEYGVKGFDWYREIFELARSVDRDRDSVIELVGRLYDEYREAFEMLPKEMLALYAIAVGHLSTYDVKRLNEITKDLLDLLEEMNKHASSKEPLPTTIRNRAKNLYTEILNTAAEAIKG
ncbi:conserved hypothetical protein [Desulfurococcaceae archaeon AG1]|nr:conserved hypothetical protein [Desulfurococcaceae archaeon AG1]